MPVRGMIEMVRILWALRPVSGRTLARRVRRNASDAAFWEELARAHASAMGAAGEE